jgi:hypothetical protein
MTDFGSLIRVLAGADVRFILVGGFAGTVLGSPRVTIDLDVVYSREPANLERLVTALAPVKPYLRGAPAGLPFVFDVATVSRGLNFTLSTTLGDLDLLGDIPGGGTYERLLQGSSELTVLGTTVRVVSLRQLIHLKRAAGRPKDLESIAELELLLEAERSGRR